MGLGLSLLPSSLAIDRLRTAGPMCRNHFLKPLCDQTTQKSHRPAGHSSAVLHSSIVVRVYIVQEGLTCYHKLSDSVN
jgi:hypothetical protein